MATLLPFIKPGRIPWSRRGMAIINNGLNRVDKHKMRSPIVRGEIAAWCIHKTTICRAEETILQMCSSPRADQLDVNYCLLIQNDRPSQMILTGAPVSDPREANHIPRFRPVIIVMVLIDRQPRRRNVVFVLLYECRSVAKPRYLQDGDRQSI